MDSLTISSGENRSMKIVQIRKYAKKPSTQTIVGNYENSNWCPVIGGKQYEQ